jgi:CRISPR-associated protein Cmr2
VVQFHRDGNNVVTHPLAGGYALRLPHSQTAAPNHAQDADTESTVATSKDSSSSDPLKLSDVLDLFEHQKEILGDLGSVDFGDAAAIERGFRILWRRFRDELGSAYPEERLLWERIPGDSRVPDHSIWEHLKVVSALAFLDRGSKQKVPQEKEPWLFSFSLSPVQSFIEDSRKSRDLWVGSFLLADLAWYAMLPIVERYGPDAIVYPDLRGNPRVDNWLHSEHREALPNGSAYPITHAAVLPHTFTAILPRGGTGHLEPIEQMAKACSDALDTRWSELAGVVREWLGSKAPSSGWIGIWDRQHRQVISSYWSAVHWQVPLPIEETEFARLFVGGALPGQDRGRLPTPSDEARESATAREQRLHVWMPDEVWTHYEGARAVFGKVNLGYLQTERGFDYALTHHELRMRQQLRKQEALHQSAVAFNAGSEGGEKCTQCRQREALYDEAGADGDNIDGRRARVRKFWAELGKNLGEDEAGAERLCGVCAFKRYLIEAGGVDKGLNPVWSAPGDHGHPKKIRFPFPSTSALAAQEFLALVASSQDATVQAAVTEVVKAHDKAGLVKTMFAGTLPRLQNASRETSMADRFLRIEPQESVFPDALQALIDRAGSDPQKRANLEQMQRAVRNLRKAVSKTSSDGLDWEPRCHFAVVRLDGDRIGRLLLGDAEVMGSRWSDVIHPRVVERLKAIPELRDAGWASLLNSKRLMGPSLHAFISRALADFSHRIVPWVVEQEYAGRLVYAGGDDVLVLAPASDALPMAARLQQLFSAAWIVDTRPDVTPFEWRQRGSTTQFDPKAARLRFLIPQAVESSELKRDESLRAIDIPAKRENLELPIGVDVLPTGPFDGQVFAGLGPHQSLSASVVYGHFKTQLSTMLRRGRRLLDEVAKAQTGRGWVALAHHSRGGLKSEIALNWGLSLKATSETGEARAHALVEAVESAFRNGDLPQRLPYKLRAVASLLCVVENAVGRRTLAQGLLKQALDGKKLKDGVEEAVLELWLRGLAHHTSRSDRDPHVVARRSIEGLLLCRYLAGNGGESE